MLLFLISTYTFKLYTNLFNSSIISPKPSLSILLFYNSKFKLIKLSKLSIQLNTSPKPSFSILLFYKFKLNSFKLFIFYKYIILQYLISISSISPSFKSNSTTYASASTISNYYLILNYLSFLTKPTKIIFTFSSSNFST